MTKYKCKVCGKVVTFGRQHLMDAHKIKVPPTGVKPSEPREKYLTKI
jgi:hypothetical protein